MAVKLDGFPVFKRSLRQLTGIDLNAYKETQMLRRLQGFLTRKGYDDFYQLARAIKSGPEELGQLKNFLTINVSEFFRNPKLYATLENQLLPALAKRFGNLRVWSAGCSIGCEPYSLSMLLSQLPGRHTVLATDIDDTALAAAGRGIYASSKLANVTPQRLRSCFRQQGDDSWQVKPAVKQRVTFRKQNLLEDPYPEEMHLILCRNVVIYFTGEAQLLINRQFASSLVPGGQLMVGATERIAGAKQFGLSTVSPFVYQKVED